MFTGARSSKLAWFAIMWIGACGDEVAAISPAPGPAPEFDDPFADEALPATPAAPAEVVVAAVVPTPTEVASAEVGTTPESVEVADTPKLPESGSAVTVASRKAKRAVAPVPRALPPVPAQSKAADDATPAPIPAVLPAPASMPAPMSTPVQAPAPGPERFAGSFSYVGGQAQRDQVEAAIEATVMALNVMFRPIARKRITAGNPLREQVGITVAGKSVSVSFGADRKVSGTLDGPGVAWTDEAGSPLVVTFSLVKGRIVMHCQGQGGARRNVFTLDESGDKLTMSVTMSSDRLPVPVKYALTYRRK